MSGELRAPSEEQLKQMRQKSVNEIGLIGQLFGKGENSRNSMGWSIIVILFLGGMILTFINHQYASNYWEKVIPTISMTMGYILRPEKQ